MPSCSTTSINMTPILTMIPKFSEVQKSNRIFKTKREQMKRKMGPRMKIANGIPKTENVMSGPWDQRYRKMRLSVSYLEALFPASVQQMEQMKRNEKKFRDFYDLDSL
ncbi:hypothetical protein GCK72_018274 [Caenorhabditis remanei]|uniref:Uncharacterized protein n=1 Tax=Caenorhabditis remanei TaxID=31234 RepID=A0A6A5G9L0_CAERE|nr:hypothetical protein GCK72_018274 [Caenorhabditis remanei]KAF1751720.1 hypothetical protein GCK72_018274 [Caenorhabditis remanei]